jgi:flagellar hook-basal body complex protein FliE
MALIGSTLPVYTQAIRPPLDLTPNRETLGLKGPPGVAPVDGKFDDIFGKLVGEVEQRQADASAVTRSVLLGDNPNLHQSVIAMQEASLSFSLMVEVRNKVVEGYQELMRMPV